MTPDLDPQHEAELGAADDLVRKQRRAERSVTPDPRQLAERSLELIGPTFHGADDADWDDWPSTTTAILVIHSLARELLSTLDVLDEAREERAAAWRWWGEAVQRADRLARQLMAFSETAHQRDLLLQANARLKAAALDVLEHHSNIGTRQRIPRAKLDRLAHVVAEPALASMEGEA